METYETGYLLIGATAFAAGACQIWGKNALVVDDGDLPAAEFTAALRSDGGEGAACSTEAAAALQSDLQRRGILPVHNGVWPHLPAIHPVICERFLKSGARFLFRTAVLSVRRTAEGWLVRLFTTGGLRAVRARRLLDTTARGVLKPLLGEERPRAALSLNAAVRARGAVQPVQNGPFSVYPGVLETEGYLRFALPAGTSCLQAHEMLYRAWAQRDARLADLRIAYAAPVLDVLPDALQGDGWRPSVCFGNAVRAFDAGVQYAQGKGAQGV